MTTEEKKAALIEAGVKVRSNASDETVAELWEEHLAGSHGDDPGPQGPEGEDGADDSGISEDVVSVEVTSDLPELEVLHDADTGEKLTMESLIEKVSPSGDIMAEFKRILETLGTKQLGARTPAVFEWADANLPADEWNKIYAGKRYNGEILQPKA